jgi:hypothetical protein
MPSKKQAKIRANNPKMSRSDAGKRGGKASVKARRRRKKEVGKVVRGAGILGETIKVRHPMPHETASYLVAMSAGMRRNVTHPNPRLVGGGGGGGGGF